MKELNKDIDLTQSDIKQLKIFDIQDSITKVKFKLPTTERESLRQVVTSSSGNRSMPYNYE
jgi:hypothetical protein